MLNLTGEILQKITPKMSADKADILAYLHNKICPEYGIDTPDIFHELYANELAESGEFTVFEENLNYRAITLTKTWKTRFPTIESAQPYAHNPKKLAEKVYDNRKDLGNDQPGDGWALRGSGPIQNTGKLNMTAFTNYYNAKFGTTFTAYEIAEKLRNDLEMGVHSACWLFAISKKLIPMAIDDNFKAIVKRINGAYTGMEKRTGYYELCKKYIL